MDESKENGYQTFRFQNETGEGSITAYMVFPGVMLAYNDFHMNYSDSAFQTDQDVFCIDYCREGRLEYPAGKALFLQIPGGADQGCEAVSGRTFSGNFHAGAAGKKVRSDADCHEAVF